MCSRSAVAAPTLIPIFNPSPVKPGGAMVATFCKPSCTDSKRDLFLENPPEHKTTPREAKAFLSAPALVKTTPFILPVTLSWIRSLTGHPVQILTPRDKAFYAEKR